MKKFSLPYALWMVFFIVLPLLLIVLYSFGEGHPGSPGDFVWTTWNYGRFFEPLYIKILVKSLWLSLLSTVFCLAVGYPVAYFISMAEERRQGNLILLIIVPMWMNFLLRTYAWLTLLGNNGVINRVIGMIGLGPWDLMYNDRSIFLGMVYNFLPFMVLPIYSVLVKIDKRLLEAAADLGAGKWTVFWKVIFPLSLSGVVTGITMVFIPAISTFVIPNLLGGNKYYLIGNLIEQQFRYTGDWGFGSALSVMLMIILLITLGLTRSFRKEGESGGVLF